MEEEKKEFNEVEEKTEVVEGEIVEETVSEEIKSEEAVEPEEVIEPGISRTFTIEEETYMEFFNRNSIKQQVKTSIYIVIALWAILYILRGEQTIPQFLLTGAIYTAIFLGVTIIFTLLTTKVFVKRNYKKSQLGDLQIDVRFNNQGITQSIGEQSALTTWAEIVKIDETEKSLFCYAASRRAIILSTKNLLPGDIEMIRSIAKANIGEDNYHIIVNKKKDDFSSPSGKSKGDGKDYQKYDKEIK